MRRTEVCAAVLALLISCCAAAAEPEPPAQSAAQLQEQAQGLLDSGRYQDGIDVAKRAVALREQAQGLEHPDVAASLQTLGVLYQGAGSYESAEAVSRRALAIREKALGPEHPDTVKSITNLANLYVVTGAYSQAEPLYQRALTTNERILGEEHLETSRALVGLANLYLETAAYDRAEPLYQRALMIRERLFGDEHASIASVLTRLATLYSEMGAYARAKPLYRRALVIREKLQGSEHPETTLLLGNIGLLCFRAGEYAEAAGLLKRSLATAEKTLGAEHPYTSKLLNNLGRLYAVTGAYELAEAMFRRALSIQEKTPEGNPADTILSLSGLASMYLDIDRPQEAQVLYQQALTRAEDSSRDKNPQTISVITGRLGYAYLHMRAYDKAEPLLMRAIALSQASDAADTRETASFLSDLAELYVARSMYSRARPLYQRAITIYEKVVGPEHPDLARTLKLLAVLHWARGESQQALSLLSRVQRIQTRNSKRFLTAGSESRKQDYVRALVESTFDDVSFSMSTSGRAATALGLTSVLQHKGRVLDAVSDTLARVRRSVTPADRGLLEQLADVASQLSSLTYGQDGDLQPEQYRKRLAQLTLRQEQLETQLASSSAAFKREISPVTLASVQQAIPVNAALVEWFRYIPFDPTHKDLESQRGAPRYVAYVLKRGGEPIAVDIGPAQPIELLIRRLRSALSSPDSSDFKLHSKALSDKLLVRLHSHLRGVGHLLISPDGELNLVPMAALVDESGTFLTERFDVSYLTSGRDLLRIGREPATLASAVVVADPDYGKPGSTTPRPASIPQSTRSPDLDRGGLIFRSLAGSALEAQDLRGLLKLDAASVLLRQEASESRLKQLQAPFILHIASHGFFLSDQQFSEQMPKQRGSRLVPTSENPLLRSGLALAGANARSSGEDDGILTALEATQLDLHGTELVVLSACDSGVGEIQNGEGIYGPRRALALAGAQTQVTSLWKVSDEATRVLMVDYYKRLLQHQGRSEALRQVQRTMLQHPIFLHPYYWASFIPIGNWHPLPALPQS